MVESASSVTSTRITLAHALTEDSRYCWRVCAVSGGAMSTYSAPNSFRVELPAPSAAQGGGGCGSAPGLAFLAALLLGLVRRRRR